MVRFLLAIVLALCPVAAWASDTTPAIITTAGCLSAAPSNPIASVGTITSSGPIDNQTNATTYAVPSSDNCGLLIVNATEPVALSIAAASTAGFTAPYRVSIHNSGPSVATLTPTTSTVNGGASLPIPASSDCTIRSDGTNYQVEACDAVLPASPLFATSGSIQGSMQAVQRAVTNSVPGSDFLSNATYWTATGLTTPTAEAAPDGTTNAVQFTTGAGTTEALSTTSAFGASMINWLGGVYTGGNTVQILYLTQSNGSGASISTTWFDTQNCLVLSHTGSAWRAAFAVKLGNASFPTCYIGTAERNSTAPLTASLTIGAATADGSTTWSGGSGSTFMVWGADAVITASTGGINQGESMPPPHISTGAATVIAPAGRVNLDADIANRLLYSQITAPTVSCNGTGTAALTSGVLSSDAMGSLTTNTSATSCTVTFANSPVAWGVVPVCFVQSGSASSIATSTETATALTIALSSALTSAVVKWHCAATIN